MNVAKKLLAVSVFALSLFLSTGYAMATLPVKVDVYSGIGSSSGGGTPYSNLVGSFDSADIMFATNNGYAWHPFGLGSFGAEMTGLLKVSSTNNYSFALNSDDGSMLYIDGSLVINNGNIHGPNIVNGNAALAAGLHSFKVDFYEAFGGESGVDLYLPNGVIYNPVPEPATLLLLGSGFLGLGVFKRKKD